MSEKTQLSKERMGEIALLLLTHRMAKELPTAEELRRDLPNRARELGLELNEARAFIAQILPRVVGIRLGCSEVSLTFAEKQEERRDPCAP